MNAVLLAFGQVELLAVGRQHDAVGKGQAVVEQVRLARLIDVVDGADRLFATAAAGIAEIEAAVGRIERQIVRSAKWLAVALFGRRVEQLAVGSQVQHGVLAGVADQVRAVGQNLVAVRRPVSAQTECLPSSENRVIDLPQET